MLRQKLASLLQQKERLLQSAQQPADNTKSTLAKIDAEIRFTQDILSSLVITTPPAPGQNRVRFGARVTLRRSNADQVDYQIVGLDEADPEQGRISWLSPLARQLLTRRVGDRISFKSPGGYEDLEIIAMRYD
jgi:transcription elongation factor GreB